MSQAKTLRASCNTCFVPSRSGRVCSRITLGNQIIAPSAFAVYQGHWKRSTGYFRSHRLRESLIGQLRTRLRGYMPSRCATCPHVQVIYERPTCDVMRRPSEAACGSRAQTKGSAFFGVVGDDGGLGRNELCIHRAHPIKKTRARQSELPDSNRLKWPQPATWPNRLAAVPRTSVC